MKEAGVYMGSAVVTRLGAQPGSRHAAEEEKEGRVEAGGGRRSSG